MSAIRIALASPAELFSPPVFDPFAGRTERQSGVDQALRLLDHPGRRHATELELAIEDMEGRDATAIEGALTRFCAAETEALGRELRQVRRHGVQSLWIGLPALGVCLALSSLAPTLLDGGFGNLLSNSLIIAGWVAMWRPSELLLYEWWPFRHRISLLRRLAGLKVRLVSP